MIEQINSYSSPILRRDLSSKVPGLYLYLAINTGYFLIDTVVRRESVWMNRSLKWLSGARIPQPTENTSLGEIRSWMQCLEKCSPKRNQPIRELVGRENMVRIIRTSAASLPLVGETRKGYWNYLQLLERVLLHRAKIARVHYSRSLGALFPSLMRRRTPGYGTNLHSIAKISQMNTETPGNDCC